MEAGVRLADPARFDVRGTLVCGADVEIDINCLFEGQVQIADGARIGANCVIRDARIGAGAVIHPFTHIEGATVGEGRWWARLRGCGPGAELGAEVHIGNFVEVKNSTLAAAPRPTTWPTWATPRWASGSTTAPAASPPTTMAPTSTAP
jgi:bifunctional UDP-N-acetylglucosamine pyrophosphorylase/glucosamine-1-phosphate N-acetyltransferase